MAFYDNKNWLLSHISYSFISTDDTGMCEVVMTGDKVPKHFSKTLESLPMSDSSEDDDDDLSNESYDIQLDMNIGLHRQRSDTTVRLEKMDLARKKASKVKFVKWEANTQSGSRSDLNEFFVKKDLSTAPKQPLTSLLSKNLQLYTNIPQNPYIEYAKFDGSGQSSITTRKYKIFLTMLPEEQRTYPISICCIATAKIQDLIGLICLKSSSVHGEYIQKPLNFYGLYITEENGEVDHDLPCLDPKECVVKYGFTCLGFVEHTTPVKNVSFDVNADSTSNDSNSSSLNSPTRDDTKQSVQGLLLMKTHKTAMEAPLYESYRVFIINKVRTKVEIHLGISGDKVEIDPVQQKSSKFSFAQQKAVSHNIDSIASCEFMYNKNNKSVFRIVYSPSFTSSNCGDFLQGAGLSPVLQTSANFKHYYFETEHQTVLEIVDKMNHILDLRSSSSRKEYLTSMEKKYRRKYLMLK